MSDDDGFVRGAGSDFGGSTHFSKPENAQFDDDEEIVKVSEQQENDN